VNILPIRVSERVEADGTVSGRGLDAAGLAAGLRAAVAQGATVVNMSISVARDDPALRRAVADALAADVVIVAAVGNQHDRGDPTPYPAAYPGVVGVGSIGPDGARAAASQAGSYVDIVAPGEGVVGAVPGHGHIAWSGTSFATPFVSATAALIRAHRPELRQADVVRRLLATADPAPATRPSPEYGRGVLNPIRAVTEVLPSAPPTVDLRPRPAGAGPAVGASAPRTPLSRALPLAGVIVASAVIIGLIAVAIPVGRRRRWRPGRVIGRSLVDRGDQPPP
jgi:subtilisin family serine protease